MINHSDLHIRLGPPGTGKTTNLVGLPAGVSNPTGLVGVVEQELASGTRPDRIAFVAFTKKAATEATERACQRFSYRPDQLPYFRTLHSLAFKQLGLRPDRVMQWAHYRDLGRKLGLDLKPSRAVDDALYGMNTGDRVMYLEGLARVKRTALQRVWRDADEVDIPYPVLERFSRALAVFKDNHGLLDYTDMLEVFVQRAQAAAPVLDVLIVDEAQDLSPVQWEVVEALAAKAKRVYVAGDDDQAIYRWAGADVETFMSLRGETQVLGESFRIPALVHQVAGRIVQRIRHRSPKQWKPRTEAGMVRRYSDPEAVDLSHGTWLLLARNGYMLRGLEDLCMRRGFSFTSIDRNPLDSPALRAIVVYERLRKGMALPKGDVEAALKLMSARHCSANVRASVRHAEKDKPVNMAQLQEWGLVKDPPIWHVMLDEIKPSEREFFIAARRRGETLTKTPRIKISTIHTAKGGEADHVLLLTDMSARTFKEMERRMDDELRVWYVAVTRARHGLHLIQPQTGNSFQL